MHAADPHDEVLRLALAVHADLHVQAVGGGRGPALGRSDGDPAEGQVSRGGAGGRADRVQPRVGPRRHGHFVGLDHAEPEIRVIPGEVAARVQAQGRTERGQRRQIEVAWHGEPRINRGHDVQPAPWPVASQPAEQFRGPVADASREAGQDQDVVRDGGPGGGRVVGLHRVVDVGQPGLRDLHDVAGQHGQQGLGLGRAGRDPDPATAHPHVRGQPQERAQVPALPHRVGEREPHRARPGCRGQPQGERLEQRPGPVRPVGEPALADQQVAVPGEPRHGRHGRQVLAYPEHPDAQAVRRRRLRVGLVGRPSRGAEVVQRPRMRGGQRRHGAEQGPGGLAVQVVPLAVARRPGRGGQAKVGGTDLGLDRLDRHIHLCDQPAHPHGQPVALDRQP